MVDFTNGFTETYGDPLGLKASWEGYANFKDLEATARTEKLSANAQWFEDHSPVDDRFKKAECRGVSAKVIKAAILGGDLYPASAIGINLPNSNWVRAEYGSKSVTIGNLTDAYNKAAHGNGFLQEFVIDDETLRLLRPLPRHLRRPAYRPARMPRAWKRQTPAGRGPGCPESLRGGHRRSTGRLVRTVLPGRYQVGGIRADTRCRSLQGTILRLHDERAVDPNGTHRTGP